MIAQIHLSGDEVIARNRIRTVTTRLALGGLAAMTAYLLHPGVLPIVWCGLYGLTQVVDVMVFRSALARPADVAQSVRIASVVISTAIFSLLSIYNWFLGGEEGRIFAAISVCCSLLSVTVTMYASRAYVLAAGVPHALCLIGLTLTSLVVEPATSNLAMAIVIASIVTFLLYLAVAVRTLNGSMAALHAFSSEADRQRAVAEEASAAKTNFLAVITHEIRTPMNAVVSAVNLMKRTPLNDEQRAHLGLLSEASDVLLSLLNDVLDLSKIEAGKMTFEAAPVEIADMMRNLQTLFWPQAQQKKLNIRTQVDPNVSTQIVSDPLRLRQILFNLVSNAVKFSDKGAVRIRVRTAVDGAATRLCFDVEDEGIGIRAGDLDRIFCDFEQAEAATTRRYGGTGMGLAISRRLARLMGGDVTVRSDEGRGSCFTLSLPYEAVRGAVTVAEAAEVVAVEAPRVAPVHVLIVDDHEVNRRIVSLFLEPLGWGWTMAENGVEAIDLCHTRPFDVILMDMQMPVMDGIAATRAIRAERGPNQSTPIVALSANAMDHHRRAWAEVGVEDFLAKPIDPESLITTLAYKAAGQTTSVSEVA